MASFVGLSNRIYLAQLDLSGLANKVDFGPVTCAMQTATTFNDGGFECVRPGLITGAGMISGFQDWTVDVLDDDISIGQLGAQYPFTVFPSPTGAVAAGDAAWFSRGTVEHLNPFQGAIGDMASFELGLPFDTAPVQGKVAAPLASATGNVIGTAVPLVGPTAGQRLYAALHVTAYSGFTNVVFTLGTDDNPGFSSPTTRITFSTVTGRTSQFASVAGPFNTETYARINTTVTGSGSISYVAAFGVI